MDFVMHLPLHSDTNWHIPLQTTSKEPPTYMDSGIQDLKDFARKAGVDVVYSETSRSGEG